MKITSKSDAGPVFAVILTFNALKRIERCLETVYQQTRLPDVVLVVDNYSSDGTLEFLEKMERSFTSLRVIRTDENLGPAGGFHRGIGVAFDSGAERIWLLDDDSEPAADCLELLLEALGDREDAIAWSRNVDEHGRDTSYPAWRGELLPRTAVSLAGLPEAAFFWGQEDTEYLQWRLQRQYKFIALPVTGALVRYTDFNPRKRASWHYYYLTRNTIYYRLWVQRARKPGKLLRAMAKFSLKIILVETDKASKARFMMLGAWHGLRRRLGKTIDPLQQR